jgi:hypothetical protein
MSVGIGRGSIAQAREQVCENSEPEKSRKHSIHRVIATPLQQSHPTALPADSEAEDSGIFADSWLQAWLHVSPPNGC